MKDLKDKIKEADFCIAQAHVDALYGHTPQQTYAASLKIEFYEKEKKYLMNKVK